MTHKSTQMRLFSWLLVAIGLWFSLSPGAAGQMQVAPRQPIQYYPVPYLSDGSFELPNLTPPDFCYSTDVCTPPISQSPWNLQGGTGVATDGSGFTAQNPNAPLGNQVLFVQGGPGSIASQVAAVPAGHFRIRLEAAQREHGATIDQQVVSVRVDGVEVDQIDPTDDQYRLFKSHSFQLTAGNHTISLVGLNPAGGDNTLLIDDVRLIKISASDLWDNDGAWASGSAPGPTTHAVIEAGDIVILNTDATVRTLTIHGELHCANQDISLTADYILVTSGGSFHCGSEQSPFTNRFVITLIQGQTGDMGQKFLGAKGGGRIEIHGEPRVSWTRLSATADSTSTSLSLVDPVDWRDGDRLILAPSNSVIREGERVEISGAPTGQSVPLLTPPIQ